MATNQPIEFWFSIGSTYTYLSVMRLVEVARSHGIQFVWQPFNVRQIMIEQNNRPFVGKLVKTTYMWRDIERRAAMYGLTIRVPAPYPLKEMEFANRIAMVGAEEGWCAEYTVASYRRWFQEGMEPGMDPNLSESLREIGHKPGRVIAEARQEETGTALQAATDRARSLGIFGSPTFVVGDEIFWGDDRLEDAITWSLRGSLRSPTAS